MKTNVIGVLFVAGCLNLFGAEPSRLESYGALAQVSGGSPTRPPGGEGKTVSEPPVIKVARRQAGQTFSSLDTPKASEPKEIEARALLFRDIELEHVLNFYQELSGRTVVRALNLPSVRITLMNESALSRREALQTLDTVLAGAGIAMIISGESMIKAVPASQAPMEAGPIIDWPPDRLPDSGTFIVYIVHTKENQMPRHFAPALQPFAKLPNSILAIDAANMLIIRDYSSNVRQMLQVIDRFGNTPMEDNFGPRVGMPGRPRDGIPERPRLPAAPRAE